MAFKAPLALLLAYLATLFYIAAMCTPWWYTRYNLDGLGTDTTFYNNNPGLSRDFFDRTNCFIDGSCITSNYNYKNNGPLQWVYTTVLILMIVGWVPWLIFVHLLHFRANKNRPTMKGRRFLMIVTAVLTMAFLVTAISVFAAGMVKSSPLYNTQGLYGNVVATNGFFGTIPVGNSLIGGIPVAGALFGVEDTNSGILGGGRNGFGAIGQQYAINGTTNYKWGAHVAWYCAIVALALIPLALLAGLALKVKDRVVVQQRTTQQVVQNRPVVVPQGQYVQQPQYQPNRL